MAAGHLPGGAVVTEQQRPTAVVTGGSRGIGASICARLTDAGYAVHFCYRRAERRAETTVARLRRTGAHIRSHRADITDPGRVAAFAAAVRESGRGVDVLVLNASGGMEREAPPGYADRINGDAQVAVLDAFGALLRPGASIVYLTSVQSHRFGTIDEFDSYHAIAASKHRGERLVGRWCLARTPPVAWTTVVSDMVDGTPAALLMDLREPDASDDRRRAAARNAAPLPTVEAVAAQVVSAVTPARSPGAYVDFVAGGAIGAAVVRQPHPLGSTQ
ncbi:hypothetical protein AWN90_15555 [Nocardia terpenica]|uniref:SDR family NAD(P)-dependent oxidoreductase n=1 Tax=Nocardia terpenica TaxID=455432 RepID=A0A164I649_9NOCA|nr:hypothetical protein AWN90_15555 [Nocardia terpenica]